MPPRWLAAAAAAAAVVSVRDGARCCCAMLLVINCNFVKPLKQVVDPKPSATEVVSNESSAGPGEAAVRLLDGGGIVRTGLLEAAGIAGSGVAASSMARRSGDVAEFGRKPCVAGVERLATMAEAIDGYQTGPLAAKEVVAIAPRSWWEGWKLVGNGIDGEERTIALLQTIKNIIARCKPVATMLVEVGENLNIFDPNCSNGRSRPEVSILAARSL